MRRLLFAPLVLAACTSSPASDGGEARLVITPGALVFPSTGVGIRTVASAELRNVGTAALDIGRIDLPEPFVLDGARPVAVAPGETATLALGFFPREPGSFEASATVRSNGGDASIRLEGLAVESAVTCAPLSFAATLTGTARSAELRCTNRLDRPVVVHPDEPRGDAAAHFRAEQEPIEAAAHAPLTVRVDFSAGAPGPYQARLSLLDEAGNELGTASLAARSVETLLATDPPAPCLTGGLLIGAVSPGRSRTQTLVLQNLGDRPVALAELAFTSPLFTVAPAATIELGPGEQKPLVVTFAPDALGNHEAWLRLQPQDASTPPLELCFRGLGAGPSLSCTPQSLDFGTQPAGLGGTQTITCTAEPRIAQEGPLRLTAVRSESSHFSVAHDTPATYAPGATFPVEVTWAPHAAGTHQSAIVLETDDARTPSLSIAVRGTATNTPECPLPTSLDFGAVAPNAARTLPLVVTNSSSGPCWLGGLTLDEGGTFFLDDASPSSSEIAAGTSRTLSVRFAPTGEGLREADIHVGGIAQRTIRVRGIGASSCLELTPLDRDLGFFAPSCRTRGTTAIVRNTCGAPQVVNASAVHGLAADVVVWGRMPLPATVPAGGAVEIAYEMRGRAAGEQTGFVHVAAQGEAAPVVAALSAFGAAQADETFEITSAGPLVLQGVPHDGGDGSVDDPLDLEIFVNGELAPSRIGSERCWAFDAAANAVSFRTICQLAPGDRVRAVYAVACL